MRMLPFSSPQESPWLGVPCLPEGLVRSPCTRWNHCWQAARLGWALSSTATLPATRGTKHGGKLRWEMAPGFLCAFLSICMSDQFSWSTSDIPAHHLYHKCVFVARASLCLSDRTIRYQNGWLISTETPRSIRAGKMHVFKTSPLVAD